MKGPSGKGDQFVELEYMKGGQMVTHPCAPLPRIKFFIRSLSPSPGPDKPLLPPTVAEVPHEPEVVAEPCPKPGHTTKVPPRAAAWGQLTMKHFFGRPSGEHVQLFRMAYDRKKGFEA